ncbi:MAG TPA: GTP cyclohydrolase I [Gemmatimonadales bacterium]|nr:GTP cyclohydrolase I [Gemmatimonadales bacterium]
MISLDLPAVPARLRHRAEAPVPPAPSGDEDRVTLAVRELMDALGLDRSDPHLADTDRRVARAWRELLAGHLAGEAPALRTFPNEAGYRDALTVLDIPLHSICAHHLLPFFGRVHIAYLPGDRLLGLSKFTRLVEHLARRPQVQERLTAQIADALQEVLDCPGLLVQVEARHLCVELRGVRSGSSRTTTVAARGRLAQGPPRDEVLSMIARAEAAAGPTP